MPNLLIKLIIMAMALLSIGGSVDAGQPCGDWEVYNNEQCFKVFEFMFRSHSDIKEFCHSHSAHLLQLKTSKEQKFYADYLLNKANILDSVWLGAEQRSNGFVWTTDAGITGEGGIPFTYSNWADFHPQTEYLRPDYCVQLDRSNKFQTWIHVPCKTRGIVVCQKDLELTDAKYKSEIADLQQSLRETILKLDQSLEEIRKQFVPQADLQSVKDAVKLLQDNPLPQDFIYVQLPWQSEPKVLWPLLNFEDISGNYSGIFFRVFGENVTEPFGTVQEENSPRITQAGCYWGEGQGIVDLPVGKASPRVIAGDYSETDNSSRISIEFVTSDGEVRPRNLGVKVWKRQG